MRQRPAGAPGIVHPAPACSTIPSSSSKREDTDMAEGTPEGVALDLFSKIVLCERISIGSGGDGGRDSANRKWILDTYAECLLAVKEPNGRLSGS